MKKFKKKKSLRDRFQYWFDNKMTKGSFGLIKVLIVFTFIFIATVTAIMLLFGILSSSEEDKAMVNSLTTVINAQTPEFGEKSSPGYIVLLTIAAITGIFFTSVLIGIITSAIETRLSELRKGNSLVIEEGHVVILGFVPGEYTLIEQLIYAADGRDFCIVVADSLERDEMENYIYNNIKVPKNFRIICRSVDIFDPNSISKCSIETCKTVIISPMKDKNTIKAVLAVSAYLQRQRIKGISVNALLSQEWYSLPEALVKEHQINTIQTNNLLARMIAHSCTQKGLSEAFREIFNFEGNEFYVIKIEESIGHTFLEIMNMIDNAAPIGIVRQGVVVINPEPNTKIQDYDEIIVFSENKDSYIITSYLGCQNELKNKTYRKRSSMSNKTVIIGRNESLELILSELPEDVFDVTLAIDNNADKESIYTVTANRGLKIEYFYGDTSKVDTLTKLVLNADHIVLLNDHKKSSEDSDMEIIFCLLNLKDIRLRYNLNYNITAEMREEKHQKLVLQDDHIDFLVSSKMSSLILTQLAESPELKDVFEEILSNKGNELYLKSASTYGLEGEYTVRELRNISVLHKWVMLGYINDGGESVFNPKMDERITLSSKCSLIVLSEK